MGKQNIPQIDSFLLGVPKAGTTWLSNVLTRHPGISVSYPKEVNEIATHKGTFRRENSEPDWSRYSRSFSDNGKKIDCSISTFACPIAPSRISSLWPGAKFIICVREPISRAISHWKMILEIREDIENGEDWTEFQNAWQDIRLRENSLYGHCMERWTRFFPMDRFLIIDSKNMKENPGKVIREVFSHLNVENAEIDLDRVFSNTGENRSEQEKIILGEINVENLEIVNKSFRNVDINFTNSRIDQNWNIDFNGEEINGEVKYTKKSINKNGNLDINLKNLSINENKNTENTTSYKINKIPDLKINIGNFVFKNNKLGHLNLLAKKSAENIINIDELNFKKPGFNIRANGSWSGIDGIDKSNFHIKIETDSIKKMFETFSYETANIKNGKTLMEIDTEWVGSPMDFQMKNLNGQLKMNIEKGQFLDIEPKAGRLFGLLSIQALPRRLSLDFTDFFSEGFTFDSIKGDFNLENGQAYTNNLQMIGPSGDIMINGRTGLVAEDYDQIATVVPKVSDSLPVASALFGPVGVGVGAVLYFAGELFESIPTNIDKILSQQYSIKGNWENPEINKISLE